MRYCDYNNHLKCPYRKDCPLQDREFTNAIEYFLYTGRQPVSCNLDPISGIGGHDLQLSNFFKAVKALVLGSEITFEYPYFDATGVIKMTKRKCREWRSMRYKWYKMYK